jgi:ATP-dependent DNA helicase RecQ
MWCCLDENIGWPYYILVGGICTNIETYGIVKITDKGLSFINKPSSLMSEDHQYNEAGDHAIVSASKSSGAIDEVLMGMLRDLRKRVSKKIRTAICCFSRSFTRDMA